MKKINTQFGIIYIEDYNKKDRIKIYDSNKKYLHYIYIDSEEDYIIRCEDIENCETLYDFLDYIMLDGYFYSENQNHINSIGDYILIHED